MIDPPKTAADLRERAIENIGKTRTTADMDIRIPRAHVFALCAIAKELETLNDMLSRVIEDGRAINIKEKT